MSKHFHTWKQLTRDGKKVACGCGKVQYTSKLTPKQRSALKNTVLKYEPEPQDFLCWVGKSYYTVESFIKEARKMGVCKRIPMLPRGIVVGKSRVFLAYSVNEEVTNGWIFAYFVVQGISYVVAPGINLPDEFKERGVTEYEILDGSFGLVNERGCGNLKVGGTYLLSEKDMEKCRDLAQSGNVEGQLTLLDPEVPTNLKRFRGYRCIDGDWLLKGKSEFDWLRKGKNTWRKNKKAIRLYKRAKKKLEKDRDLNEQKD